MEKPGNQSRHRGEDYSSYMRRLYHKPLNRGIAAINDPNNLNEIKEKWAFRPPVSLTSIAYKFMRKHDMSITTYLTYAMHNLHNTKNG